MSWYILTHQDQPITVPDELESFVHVLIYAAVRLVAHNFPDIRGFISDYFDGYSLTAHCEFGCPAGKRLCITNAKLDDGDIDLVFGPPGKATSDHPLNKLVKDLLAIIRARYIVLEYEKRRVSEGKKHQAPSSPLSHQMSSADVPMLFKETFFDPGSDIEEESEADPDVEGVIKSSAKAVVWRSTGKGFLHTDPSPEVFAAAKSLEQHSTIHKLLRDFLKRFKWPHHDTVPDRLREYTPRSRESTPVVGEESTRKKARVDTGKTHAVASSSCSRSHDCQP